MWEKIKRGEIHKIENGQAIDINASKLGKNQEAKITNEKWSLQWKHIIRHLKNNKRKINFHANKFNNIDEKDNFLEDRNYKIDIRTENPNSPISMTCQQPPK